MHLILFACPGDPSAALRESYSAALAPLGEVKLAWLTARGLSSTFSKMAVRMRRGHKRLLPQLLQDHTDGRKPQSVTLISYSAGYGFARELLGNSADRQALTGYVALDSIHADLDADGSAADAQLGGFVAFAKRAQSCASFFWIGHTDVKTHGYASTTNTAHEIERLAGGQRGDFMVAAYDLHHARASGAEHRAALKTWGPGFVAEAVIPFVRTRC